MRDKKPTPQRTQRIDYAAIDRTVDAFLVSFRAKHALQIAQDPRGVILRLRRAIRSGFPLKRGPRPSPRVVKAHELKVKEGLRGRKLLRAVVRGFDGLDQPDQHLIRKNFYSKLKRYENSLLAAHEKQLKTRAPKIDTNSASKKPGEMCG